MKLSHVAELIGSEAPPHAADTEIERIASLGSADGRSVTFLSDTKLTDAAAKSNAAAFIVKKGNRIEGKVCLEVDDPYLGYAKVASVFEDTTPLFDEHIHPSAIIDKTALLHDSVCVGPGAVIGKDVHIGEATTVGANCTIEPGARIGANCRIDSGVIIRFGTQIGDRVIVQSGTVIGSDGFANAMENGRFVRIPCFGNVVIENDVQIGACVTIDRGNFEPTVIRAGARLDNLIHIAHNVELGQHCALAAQVGISGSTRVGDHVLIGGQAGFVGHIEIGDKAFVGAKAGVSKSVEPGAKVTGYPARDFMKMRRIEAAQQELPAMLRQIKRLANELEELKKKLASS